MNKNWNLLVTSAAPGSWNMAVDQYLMENRKNCLRFYQWQKPTLSLGYFQKISEIDTAPVISNEAGLVRRLTGGKAVLHDHEITYSVTADSSDFPGPLRESYRMIGKALTAGLEELGVKADLIEREPQRLEDGNCFKIPGWYEVVFQGKKLIGSAQTRKKGRILQHGSLLIDCNRNLLNRLFPEPEDQDSSLITLKDIMKEIPTDEILIQALIKGFLEKWNLKLSKVELSNSDLEEIEKYEARYLDEKWNKAR